MLADARLNDDTFDLGGIDISSLNLDDDNDDQIKSILGKRPVAPSSISSSLGSKKVVVELNEKEETEGIFVDAEGRLRKMDSGGKERDIAADIFRAKTAGRYTDEETREADEAAFRDFLKLEEEVERSLELLDNEAPSVDIDIDAYAGMYCSTLFDALRSSVHLTCIYSIATRLLQTISCPRWHHVLNFVLDVKISCLRKNCNSSARRKVSLEMMIHTLSRAVDKGPHHHLAEVCLNGFLRSKKPWASRWKTSMRTISTKRDVNGRERSGKGRQMST